MEFTPSGTDLWVVGGGIGIWLSQVIGVVTTSLKLDARGKGIATILLCLIAASVEAWRIGGFRNEGDWLASGLSVLLGAVGSYNRLWKPTGPACMNGLLLLPARP